MSLNFFVWSVIYILIIFLSITLIVYVVKSAKRSSLLYTFLFVQIVAVLTDIRALVAIIALSYINNQVILDRAFDILNWKYGIFVGGELGLSWILFILNYINWKYAESKLVILLLSFPTLLFTLAALTNNFHHLMVKDFYPGPFYVIHAAIAYLYSLVGLGLFIRHIIMQKGPDRKKTLLLTISYALPLLFFSIDEVRMNIFYVKPILGYIDIVPLCFSLGIAMDVLIIFKYRFLNIKVLALNKIVNSLHQSIIIVDSGNRVIDWNNSFSNISSGFKELKSNVSISVLSSYLRSCASSCQENDKVLNAIELVSTESIRGELHIASPGKKYYDVIIKPVLDKDILLGRVILFDDITLIKENTEELQSKNSILIERNNQLQDYAYTVEELAIARERNRVSREVHDTLGHTMIILITQLKVAGILCDSAEPGLVKQKLQEITSVAKDGLNELRRSISGMVSAKVDADDINNTIQKLIADFEDSGMKIEFSSNGKNSCIYRECFQAIFRICQEALTNALRHGKASQTDMVLNFSEDFVELYIKDNGQGCSNIQKGFGLKGMEERVADLNGNIQYGSDGEIGFSIYVELPSKTL